MMLDPSRDEPNVTLDLPQVSKHNWKKREIRDIWDNPLESFVQAGRRVAIRALQDEDHPRTMLRRVLPPDRVSDVVSGLPDEIDVARKDADDATTLVLAVPECPVDPDAIVEGETNILNELQCRGAPECCVAAYGEHRANGHDDPIATIARDTPSTVERGGELVVEEPYPILNPMWAFQGWSFIDFYPCSFECDHARHVASEAGRIYREIGHGKDAEAAYEFLTEPTYWSAYHGLAHIKSSWCIGEYTTDDYWHEEIVRFNGYHDDYGDVESVQFNQ